MIKVEPSESNQILLMTFVVVKSLIARKSTSTSEFGERSNAKPLFSTKEMIILLTDFIQQMTEVQVRTGVLQDWMCDQDFDFYIFFNPYMYVHVYMYR